LIVQIAQNAKENLANFLRRAIEMKSPALPSRKCSLKIHHTIKFFETEKLRVAEAQNILC